uniref:Odorant receptor n=1 Tax=Lutzomyia longipalpis TaxID=7200 RepID=A0A3F2ZD75_LUTLO
MGKVRVSEKCLNLFLRVSNFAKPVGGNIMDTGKGAPLNIYSYLTILNLVLYWIMNVTSVYYFRNDMIDLAFALVTLGLSLEGLVKVCVVFGCKEDIREIIYINRDFMEKFEVDSQKICRLFEKYEKLCSYCYPIVLWIYIVAILSIFVVTLIMCYWTKAKLLPYGTVIPLLDHKDTIGWIINFSYMLVVSIYAIYGIFASDYAYLTMMVMACGEIETVAIFCEDLTEYLEKNDQQDEEEIQRLIKKIVVAQQIHTKYMNAVEGTFGMHSFTIIVCSMISIAITLFVFIQEVWINGLMIAAIALWQILTLCTAGGIYMIKVSEIEMRVNSTKWYLLPRKKQKMFLNIIHAVQNPVIPSAVGLVPLNFETFVNCLKAMYQFLMVLLNMTN